MCTCQPISYNPNCYPYYPCPTPCVSSCDSSISPCPIQLDSQCIIYHKFNSSLSTLTNLNISNGATLESILTAIDPYIGQLKVSTFDVTYLRTLHVVNTLQQFIESVDTELSNLNDSITDDTESTATGWLGNLSSDPGAAVDGDYWYNTSEGEIKMKVNSGVVKTILTA